MTVKAKLPSAATVIAWLGIIGTILGIFGFFISDLPSLLGGNPKSLSEDDIVATLASLQNGKEKAEIQLTQIAVANLDAANQMTSQALAQMEVDSQATRSAVQALLDEYVSTQNAASGMTATADALNATSTQAALDAGATAAAIAQVTPTPTEMPTATPVPPAPAADFHSLEQVLVQPTGDGTLTFLAQAKASIPAAPLDGLAYVWLVDTDRDAATGQPVQDIGVDARVAIQYDATNSTWVGTVRPVQQDGTLGEPFVFTDITVDGANVTARLVPSDVGLTNSFDWVSRVEIGEQVYSLWPDVGHSSLQ